MYLLYEYEQFLSRKELAETTIKTYTGNVKLYFKFLERYKGKVTSITLCNVTKADIYNYVAYMDNLSQRTKEIRLNSLKSFYQFLRLNSSYFLFADIKLFKLNKKLPNYLFSHEIKALLNYYSDKRNSLIIFILLFTGIRISELANILIQNINFQEKYIYLKVKGGYYRNVYISDKLCCKLKDYIQNKAEGRLFNIQRREIHNIVTKPMKELDIKGSAHTLRHTFATTMYKQTKDIILVKELLGHRTLKATEIYTHLDNDFVRQAVESNPLANFEVGGKK